MMAPDASLHQHAVPVEARRSFNWRQHRPRCLVGVTVAEETGL